MTPQEFCYWLQGFLEVSEAKTVTPAQLATIKKHLDLVFTKVTSGEGRTDAKKIRALFEGLPRGEQRLC